MLLSYWLRLFCLVLFSVGILQVVLHSLWRLACPLVNRSIDRMTARWQERICFAVPIASHVVPMLLTLLAVAPQYIRNETNPLQERVGIVCVAGALVVFFRYLYALLRAAQLLLRERQVYKLNGPPLVLTGGVSIHVSEQMHPLLAVSGLLSPRIVISRYLLRNAALSQEQLEIALAHENAHVLQRDNLKYFVLTSLALSRSGSKGALRRWRCAAEIAADDDAVFGNSSRAILLAETLLIAARTVPAQRTAALSLGLLPHEEELDKRIDRLLHDDFLPAPTVSWRSIVSAAALLLIGAFTLPQLFTTAFHEIAEYVLHLG
jgi:beta-lactamase regulating signal transducer with metallopeptidase domain